MGPPALPSRSVPGPSQRGSHPALDVLELWVHDLKGARDLLTTMFGFEQVGTELPTSAGEEAACLASGGVRLVLRHGISPESPIARHVAVHGDTVGDVGLTCEDPDGIADRARARDLDVAGDDNGWRIDVAGGGTICHTVRRNPLLSPAPESRGAPRMLGVDHIACCLPSGTAAEVATVYEEVFGLERVDVGDSAQVGDEVSGMRSFVLRSELGFTVVLTEPVRTGGTGQTQRFIDAHAGPGVQHAAIAYDDIYGAVEALSSRGVEFLRIPPAYYDDARRRLSDPPLPWDSLRRLQILVDGDDGGMLFQLFSRPITARGTFFIELIQRNGAAGFGANNVRALFAAVDAANRERT